MYFTEEYLSASSLEKIKVNEGGKAVKDNLSDSIDIKIYLNKVKDQLHQTTDKTKKDPPSFVTLTVKLIAS